MAIKVGEKTIESPHMGASIKVDVDRDYTVRLSISGQWFSPDDLRWLAKKLTKLGDKLDKQERKANQ